MRAIPIVMAAALSATGCATTPLPPQAMAHNRAGAEHLRAGRLDEAEARFRLALEYHPAFSEPHANLGVVALERGDLVSAEAHLRSAIRLREDFAQAWGNLGVVFDRTHRGAEAVRVFERALSIDPGIASIRRNLAFLLARRGELGPARAHLVRLLELTPRDVDASSLLAYCELRLGRPRAALERAERVLAERPTAARALVVRGVARAMTRDLDGAVADLERGVRDPIVGRDARTRLAAVLVIRGDEERAEVLLRALLRERERDAAVHLVAATRSLAVGDATGGARHARRALAIEPRLAQARVLLAQACVRTRCEE